MFKTRLISRNQKQAAETLVPRTACTMTEQVVSTGGRARARAQHVLLCVSERASAHRRVARRKDCKSPSLLMRAFHCASRAHNLARFMAYPSPVEPAKATATCVAGARLRRDTSTKFTRHRHGHYNYNARLEATEPARRGVPGIPD